MCQNDDRRNFKFGETFKKTPLLCCVLDCSSFFRECVHNSFLFQIAKVEKLKPLEVELRRLEDLSESIVNDFAYMKKREEEMRDTNGEGREALVSQYVHRKGDRSPNFKFWCTFFSDLPKGVVWKDNCLLPCCCSTGK